MRRSVLAACCLLFAIGFSTSLQAEDPPGFRLIFDGKSLDAWKGDEKFWRVENGVIVGESTPDNPCKANTFLTWAQGDVDDFTLKLEFKLTASDETKANSGIQFRSGVKPDGHVFGYQADIDLAGQWVGACYDELGRGVLAKRGQSAVVGPDGKIATTDLGDTAELLKAVKKGDWNEYEITAQGPKITLSLNGKKSVEIDDQQQAERELAGLLALQLHSGPPQRIEFRNIRLKRHKLTDGRKKAVFVAGKPSHAPREHEHYAGCLLLSKKLEEAAKDGLPITTTVYHYGWPTDPTAFDNADTVIFYCDGGPGHYANQHLDQFDQLVQRGLGLCCIHYGVEVPKGPSGDKFLDWIGGYFEPHWSVNPHWTANYTKFPKHPVANGVKPFEINDEWYYHMRFRPGMEGVTPILTDLPTKDSLSRPDGPHSGNPDVRAAVMERKEPQHMAWAFDRPGGKGRGFGFTGAHYHKNWKNDEFRKVVLNAIAWTAGLEVPAEGVKTTAPSDEELEQNLDPKPGRKQAAADKTKAAMEAAEAKAKSFQAKVAAETAKAQGEVKKQADEVRNSVEARKKEQEAKVAAALAAASASSKPVASSPIITASTPGHTAEIDADITGAKELFLVVTDGGDGFSCDWADWMEPKLTGPSGEKKLTDLDWKSATSDWGKVNKNLNANGQSLKVAGQPVAFGIGTHANSVIRFELPAGYTRFKSKVGLDNGGSDQGSSSSVQFHVFTQAPPAAFAKAGGSTASHEANLAVSQLEVNPELQCTLFAAEPMLMNPTNIEVDHKGRVWICEVVNYRRFRNGDLEERKEGDRILVLEDTNLDGKADKSYVFYQGRDIDSAHGILLLPTLDGKNTKALVSAGDSVFYLIDDDGDLKTDRKEVLFTGIGGVQHDHGIHAFVFGPDGKLYFNFGNEAKQIKDKNGKPIIDKQGHEVKADGNPYREGMAFRCNLDGSEFETLGWNFRNNWELAVDSYGTIWQSDNDDDGNRGVRINYVMEYGNYGYKDEFTGAAWQSPRTNLEADLPQRHWHLNDPGVVPNVLQTGNGSPTGICVYEGTLLPPQFHGALIHCDAGPNIVRAYPVKKAGAGFTGETINILDGAKNRWFRPSDVCVAPDGSLIVADWYDPGVGGHRMQDIEHGRLFRVAPPGTPYSVPTFDLGNPNGAIAALQNANQSWRYLGWQALKGFGDTGTPALQKMFETAAPLHRARALWVFGKLNIPADKKIAAIRAGLKSSNPDLRVTGIRLMREIRGEIELKELITDVNFDDPAPEVRREILLALRDIQPEHLGKHWAMLAKTYDGQDRWYLEALGIAADGHWDDCLTEWMALNGGKVKGKAAQDIIWRSRATQTARILADAIGDPETESDQLPRLFRALDFQKGPEAEKAIHSLAFEAQKGDEARQTLIASEAISRVKGGDVTSKPEMKASLDKILAKNAGNVQYVRLVDRFNLVDRYPDVIAMLQANPESQASVEAVKLLVEKGDLLKQALAGDDIAKVTATIKALAAAKENKTAGLLLPIVRDKSRPDSIRRAAVGALAASRAGLRQVSTLAEENKYDPALKEAVAAALHSSADPDTRALAAKLFPLPPGKDNKPLPSLAELATRKGDVTNGRIVFHTTGTCIQCHQVNGLGKEVGPNLSEIGKKLTKQALLESILYPSAGISHNYESWVVATDDGNVYTGLITSETADEIVLKDAKSIVRTLKKSGIDQRKKSEASMMPADLQKVITEKELVDIVEFMTTLKEAQGATAAK